MKITEILVEQQIQEGPILNKIGTAVGKGVGAAGKAVGAVAGGVAGLGQAIKKGYQAGKQTVAGAGDEPDAQTKPAAAAPGQTQTTTTTTTAANPAAKGTSGSTGGGVTSAGDATQTKAAPAAGGAKTGGISGAIDQFKKGFAQGSGQETPATSDKPGTQAKPGAAATPAAGDAQAKPTAAAAAGDTAQDQADQQPEVKDTVYAQTQKSIAKLPPEQQKELLAALMADPNVKAKLDAAVAKKNPQQQQDQTTTAQTDKTKDAGAADPTAAQKAGRPAPVTAPAAKDIDDNPNIIRGGGGESVNRSGKSISESIQLFRK